ncbi:MAG: helix-turn-helix transcriptional regulator [Muricauda sp.]|nr:AraC family transcriptional regulator [Allomuricauda sp.]MBA4745940.1 helix-turn-helix transcriptional regulator [Allomuricauda sp.]
MWFGILLTILPLIPVSLISKRAGSLPAHCRERTDRSGIKRINDSFAPYRATCYPLLPWRPVTPHPGHDMGTKANPKPLPANPYATPSRFQNKALRIAIPVKANIQERHFKRPNVPLDRVRPLNVTYTSVQFHQLMESDTVSGGAAALSDTEALTAEILAREDTIKAQLVLATLLVALLAFFYVKYRKMQSRLNIVLQEGVEPTISQVPNANIIPMDIAPEVVQRILLALDQWESQKGYLDQGTSLITLAEILGTNTSYLSKIINVYKGQTFSQYLRDLRITHAINQIKEQPELLKTRSTIQLAEQFGFNSVDVFSRAMKSKIGLTPGLFFRKVRQKHR